MPVVSSSVPVLRDPSPEEARALLTRGPVVVVTTSATLLSTLVSAGATHGWALLPHDASARAIETAARAVEDGLVVVPVLAARGLRPAPARTDPGHNPAEDEVERLTAREREVLQHVVQGLHNRAIASALGISDHTVKFHLASIFGKLGASTRTEAARVGLRRGLVQI
jgi:DNA-binding NarL/FixJ family response regulator